jgi:aminocarboxymuconate-semialdehyde decarboxylase
MSLTAIDIHTHIMPERLPKWAEKFGYGGFVTLEHTGPGCARMAIDGQGFRNVEQNCWDAHTRIHECDSHGVAVQVLSTIPVLFYYWAKPAHALETSRYLNDHIARVVAEHPTRFRGLGTVPLQDPQLAIGEMERCVKELGMDGVQIGSHVNDWNLNAPELFPFFEAAERLDACVFIHPWEMMGEDQMKQYWLPWLVGMPAESSRAICSLIFGGVFERLPKLRVAIAHGGGSFPFTLGRIAHGFEVRPDLVAVDNDVNPRDYIGRFWVDSLVHDPAAFRFLLDLFGDARIALGTDYPFPLGELQPGSLIASLPELTAESRMRLTRANALDWLGTNAKRHLC